MKRGFTLIELLIVAVITMLLVGIGAVSMTKYLAREHLISARTELLSAIKLARNYALTNQKPFGSTLPQLDVVAVTLSSAGQLTVWPVNLVSGTDTGYFTKTVGSGVTLTAINYQSLLFSVPEGKLLDIGGTNPRLAASPVIVAVSSTEGLAETMTVMVDNGGKIW